MNTVPCRRAYHMQPVSRRRHDNTISQGQYFEERYYAKLLRFTYMTFPSLCAERMRLFLEAARLYVTRDSFSAFIATNKQVFHVLLQLQHIY